MDWYNFNAKINDRQTPYLAMGNNPTLFTDPLGLADGVEPPKLGVWYYQTYQYKWLEKGNIEVEPAYIRSSGKSKQMIEDDDNSSWLNGGFGGGSGGGALTFDIEETHTQRTIHYSQSVKDYYKRIDIWRADRNAFDKVKDYLGYTGNFGQPSAILLGKGVDYGYGKMSTTIQIWNYGKYSNATKWIGVGGKVMGYAGNAGALTSTYIDYKLMQKGVENGGISGYRFSYRTIGTGIGVAVGTYLGAIPGAIAGGGIWAGEKAYDGYMNWQTQMGIFLNNFENGLKNGWVPGR